MDFSQLGFSGGFGRSFRPYTQEEIKEQEKVNAYRQLVQSQYASQLAPIQAAMGGASALDVRRMQLNAQRANKLLSPFMRQLGPMSGDATTVPSYSGSSLSNWSSIGNVPRFPYSGMA